MSRTSSSPNQRVFAGHAFTRLLDFKTKKLSWPFGVDTAVDGLAGDKQAALDRLDVPPALPPIFPLPGNLIENLVFANADIWSQFVLNKFCSEGYVSPSAEFDPKYQSYAKQDYLYLIEYARLITYRSLHEPSSQTQDGLAQMASDLTGNVKFVADFYDTCVKDMAITADDLKKARPSQEVLGYTSWEQLTAVMNDPFTVYIALIPCLYGWNKIAIHLKESKVMPQKDTYFYKYWYEANIDSKYADELNEYLEDNRKLYECPASWDRWNKAFRQACLFEIAFFKAGLEGGSPTF